MAEDFQLGLIALTQEATRACSSRDLAALRLPADLTAADRAPPKVGVGQARVGGGSLVPRSATA